MEGACCAFVIGSAVLALVDIVKMMKRLMDGQIFEEGALEEVRHAFVVFSVLLALKMMY